MADWILLTRIPSFYRCTSVAMLALLSACFVFAIAALTEDFGRFRRNFFHYYRHPLDSKVL